MTREQPLAWRKLSRTQQAELEDRVAAFEKQWHACPFPDIGEFLPQDPGLRELVRAELLAIDGEFRQRLEFKESDTINTLVGTTPENEQVSLESQASSGFNQDSIRLISNYEAPHQKHAGGLGDVWIVHEPSLGRLVAIKQLQRRWRHHARARHAFLQEVRITSLLEHPGVAPVHAVGETDDGRPCYSMRYIHGETFEQAIVSYHSNGQRSNVKLRELLGHFVTVCNTIAYAHSRGVLHRDLKPANIMIGPFGQTMVIDWGLAKQFDYSSDEVSSNSLYCPVPPVGSQGTDKRGSDIKATKLDAEFDRLQTALGEIVGTPAFMSPEQAKGQIDQISIRTDVFGLGAVLFNILYGKPPYLDSVAGGTLQRAATCKCLYPESPAMSSIPKSLAAICSMAMSRSTEKRYANATLLANDIQNWLMGEPIIAMRQPLVERLVRFARQRRTLAGSVAILLAAFCITAFVAAVVLQRERTEKLLAKRTADVKAQSANNMTEYLSRVFRTVDPVQFDDTGFTGGENLDANQTMRKVLDSGAELIDIHLQDQPEAYSEILASLGTSYRGLGEYERSEEMLQKSLAIRRERFGSNSFESLRSRYLLARCAQERGDYELATKRFREVIATGQQMTPPVPLLIADAKYNLAWTLFFQPFVVERPEIDSVAESIQLFTEVLSIREKHFGAKDRSVGLVHAGLASARMCVPEQKELAEASLALAVEIFSNSEQESALGNFLVTYRRAENARYSGKGPEAEELYLQLKETISKHLGKRHPIFIFHLWNLAEYQMHNHFDQCEATIDELRAAIAPLSNLRSTPVHLDGLCQYVEVIAKLNASKAREIALEVVRYANERPEESRPFLARAEALLDQLERDTRVTVESVP